MGCSVVIVAHLPAKNRNLSARAGGARQNRWKDCRNFVRVVQIEQALGNDKIAGNAGRIRNRPQRDMR
ncbi:MAG: hypothetical protein KDA41_13285 [Planctomycetales bacterium]|nr:hypothetical protein [Planctomycetales bacterium]